MGSAITQRRFGTGGYVFDETPSGSINGSNAVFTSSSSFASGSLRVYKNGVRMEEGSGNDFTVTGVNQFTMTSAPATGTKLLIDYQTVATSSGNASTVGGYNPAYLMLPIGSITDYIGTTAPENWLFCFGQAISRSSYSALFAICGTTYGSGDGSTTFNLPDLRGRVIAGKDDMGGTSANRLTNQSGGLNGDTLGTSGGSETHTLTVAQLPSTPPSKAPGTQGAVLKWDGTSAYGAQPGSGSYGSTAADTYQNYFNNTWNGGGQAHNIVQPTFILNKILRAL
jgi:microcystin-dependent protein